MILGQRVRLRRVEREDLDNFITWLNNPEARAGISLYLPMSRAEEEIWFDSKLEGDVRERPFSVDVKEQDDWAHVGSCGYFNIDDRSRCAELGIMIGDDSYWGQGIGRDTMLTLMRHGFETLNLNRVYLRTYEYNQRALRLYRGLGFVDEGRLRQACYHDGRYWDTILMGLLRDEWHRLADESE